MERRSSIPALFVVAVASTGLVALGIVLLWRHARATEASGRFEVMRSTIRLAEAVRGSLLDPDVVDKMPPALRFDVEQHRLGVPTEIGWILSPPPESTPLLPERIETRLAELRGGAPTDPAEFLDGMGELLLEVDEHLGQETGHPLALELAWGAHRQERTELRDSLARRLLESKAPLDPATATGLLLLEVAAGHPLPSLAGSHLALLSTARARAVLSRLSALGLAPGVRDELGRRVEVACNRRRFLARVTERRPWERDSGTSFAGAFPGGTLVYFPDPEIEGRGRGALILPELVGVQGLGATDGSARLLGKGSLSESVPVLAGMVLAVPQAEASGSAGLVVPMVLLSALGLALATGLVSALRSLAAERAALRVRTDFLQSVSHELKTPVASVRLLSEVLLEHRVENEEGARNALRLLGAEAGRLSLVVENVLDLGRMDRRERRFEMRSQHLDAVVREAMDEIRPLVENDGIEFVLAAGAGDRPVLVDRDAFRQALLNVLENARRYGKDGARIDVTTRIEADAALVEVRDHGHGIEPGERETIFERFRRGEAAVRTANPGAGIGLHLARSILVAHGGSLRCVDPPPGRRGACFVLELPLEAQSPVSNGHPENAS
jgi:signal transduction histidine kinase